MASSHSFNNNPLHMLQVAAANRKNQLPSLLPHQKPTTKQPSHTMKFSPFFISALALSAATNASAFGSVSSCDHSEYETRISQLEASLSTARQEGVDSVIIPGCDSFCLTCDCCGDEKCCEKESERGGQKCNWGLYGGCIGFDSN